MHNLDEDRIVCQIRQLGILNRPEDRVKVLLVPCYLEGNDGIFNMPYYHLLAANDLAIYPSYYEPWGYTPLESCAFRTPCVTTDLSGFGQWVNDEIGHEGKIEDGVRVIHRDDNNYFEVAADICQCIHSMLNMHSKQIATCRKNAVLIADKAQWKHFIKYYYDAYDFALNRIQLK